MKFVYGNDGNAPHGVPAMENGFLRLVFAVPAALANALSADVAEISAGDEDAVSSILPANGSERR